MPFHHGPTLCTADRGPLQLYAANQAAAAAATAAAPAALSLSQLIQPEPLFSGATYLMVPVYAIMILMPRSKLVRGLRQGKLSCAQSCMQAGRTPFKCLTVDGMLPLDSLMARQLAVNEPATSQGATSS